MIPQNASLAVDGRSLDRLKSDASRDPQGAARQAAAQFESMFMQQLLKSMRDAMPKSGMWDSAGESTYQSMLDTQLAQNVSGRPGGLGEMIARQLSRHVQGAAGEAPAGKDATGEGAAAASEDMAAGPAGSTRAFAALASRSVEARAGATGATGSAGATGIPLAAGGTVAMNAGRAGSKPARADAAGATGAETVASIRAGGAASPRRTDFVQRLWQPAAAAERATGVPATFIVGQAALETGWGRSEMRLPDGRSAHNLFGVKAGASWKGATVNAATTEYVDGQAVRKVEKFRAYGSYEEAFRDWAALIGNSPRYAGVMRAGGTVEGFAQGLQKAGYATDPNYADKLTRTINQALRIRRLVV